VDEETQNEFRKIFNFFDAGKKNKLTAINLKNGLNRLGESIKDKEIDKIFL
jgi:Ca2+-binding EF-hand superfamily protein